MATAEEQACTSTLLLVQSLMVFSFPVQFSWLSFGPSPPENKSPPNAIAPAQEKYINTEPP